MSASHTSAAARNAATLPARQGSLAGQGDAVQQQTAWQREMERAQMVNWFKPPLAADKSNATASSARVPEAAARTGRIGAAQAPTAITGNGAAAVASELTMPLGPLAANSRIGLADVVEGAAQVPRAAARFFVEMRSSVVAAALSETRPLADVQLRRGASVLPTFGESVDGSAPDAEVDAVAESRKQPSSTTTDAQAPVRLHGESTPEGQAVWIAMRANDEALAAMLPRIVADLQHGMLQVRGQRLYQVVCNGRLVWRDDVDAPAAGGRSIPGGGSRPTTVDSFHSKGA
ncbi:hypothetical protein J2W35_006480 [Variovorax boronicumulans]|uniref:hypothetical protein n=1 Tax=Variovorax boronicumulans TaxID=436515 RepID=UPI002788DCD3|nr:hypothetical protein [Variovorax boronicumulans]MDQ0086099.1 hypothetical protein [Variovorax boronicumulans]